MTNLSAQARTDIQNYYLDASDTHIHTPINFWDNWIIETIQFAGTLTADEVQKHWEENKNSYKNNPHIPTKWKSGKHLIYFHEINTKEWYFICDIEGENLNIIAACNAKALTKYANRKYGKLKESFDGYISLYDYLMIFERRGLL